MIIPPGMKIGFDPAEDEALFKVSEAGVVVVEKGRDLSRPTP